MSFIKDSGTRKGGGRNSGLAMAIPIEGERGGKARCLTPMLT